MPLIDDARRWIKDQFSHDEQISNRPKQAIAEIENALSQLSSRERLRSLDHARAYADLYYQGRHNEHVPVEVRASLQSMERRIERLNTVDKAREIVAKYGGPPTKETVIQALHRSMKERSKEMEMAPVAPKKEQVKEQAKERTMEMYS